LIDEIAATSFCCDLLGEVVAGLPEPVQPMLHVSEDGVLMMVVGVVETEDGPGYLDQAVMHCPFCGTQLQDADSIAQKVSH